MSNSTLLHVLIAGHVQGVLFRAFTREHAMALNLKGWVKNLPDGRSVEVEAEGEKENLEKFLKILKTGPPAAEVQEFSVRWDESNGKYSQFKIRY